MDKISVDFWGFAIAAEGFYGVLAASGLVLAIILVLRFGKRQPVPMATGTSIKRDAES
jgi:hypothetical protein